MNPAIKAAIAISFINTSLILLLVSFSSTLVSQAKTSPPITLTSTPLTSSSSPTPKTAVEPIIGLTTTENPTSPTPDNRCLIQVRGQVFDITQFKNIHSGGDIFQCGTDMTAVFNTQHNDSTFSTLQKYKI